MMPATGPRHAVSMPKGLARRRWLTSLLRLVVQIVCLVLFPGLFVEAFSGIRVAAVALSSGTFNATVAAQCLSTAIVLVSALLVGRVFCGWMCSFGTVQDLLSALGRRFRLRAKVPATVDRVLKGGKYVVLAAVVGLAWTGLVAVPEAWNPWEAFAAVLSWPPDLGYAFATFGVGLVLLAVLLVASLFSDRPFCRYLCPLGAVLAIVSRIRPVRVRKPCSGCGASCMACSRACPQGIDLSKVDEVRSGECVVCLRCVATCPNDNAVLAGMPASTAPVATAVCVVGALGLYQVGSVSLTSMPVAVQPSTATSPVTDAAPATTSESASTSEATSPATSPATSEAEASSSPATTAANASGYADGTYEGSGTGHKGGTTTVQVTISGGQITDVTTLSTRDDEPYYNRAFPTVTSEIIASQSADVDAVSGATHSSDGIMEAVADALASAKA